MKQHYVPRFYLNYFCDDRIQNGKYLWRYKCGESQAIKSATKRIASIPNYYTIGESDIIETKVLKRIEDRAALRLRDIQKDQFDSSDDEMKRDVAIFLSFLLMRVPASRDTIADAVTRSTKMRLHNMAQDRDRFLNLTKRVSEKTGTEIPKPDELRDFILSGDYEVSPTNEWQVKMMMDQSPEICQILMNMNWQCLVSLRGGQFITSDRPAAIFNPKLQNTVRGAGLLQKHAEIFFPVSPNKGLCLSRNDGPDIIELTPDYVHEFNKRTLYLCYREVYASQEDRQVGDLSASLPSRE